MKNLLLSTVVFLLLLIVAEFGFRLAGWVPGQFHYNQWLNVVEKLERLHGFRADEHGIFKADTAVAFDIYRGLNSGRLKLSQITPYCLENNYSLEIGSLYTDHLDPERKEGELWQRLQAEKDIWTTHDSVIHRYRSNPINRDGFYSIPFTTTRTGKGRVMLIGDSFVWGHSTSSKTLSFSNALLARGYTVFNLGISGADLPQYNAILKHYYHQLQPDIVVVNLFMGNDVMPYERKVEPYQPVLYSTNAGNIYSFQVGEQFETLEGAFQNVYNNMVVPKTNKWNILASKTVVSSLAWAVCAKIGLIDHKFTELPSECDYEDSQKELERVVSFCDLRKVPLIVSIIPELDGNELRGAEKFPSVFTDDIEFFESDIGIEGYKLSDGHFNDSGHQAYADYLEKLVEKKLAE